ncbi:DUF5011 domain-containing protein, partial [Patescibacteria group bacterium]|nr:DUF5011 domain-containing protein [Patescibacteria group bacterium]
MNKKSIFNKILDNKIKKFKVLGIMLFLVTFLFLPAQNVHADDSVLAGSIKICAISVNQDFELISDSNVVKSFEFSQNLTNDNGGIIENKEFDTTEADSDILKDIEGLDANCFTYKNLNLGTYYYNQVQNDGSFSSFYNNSVGDSSSFYSSSLDTVFYKHNMNIDSLGFLTLSNKNPNKILIILNVYNDNIAQNNDSVISARNNKVDLGSPYSEISLRTFFNRNNLSRTNDNVSLEKITGSSGTSGEGIITLGSPPGPSSSSAPNSRPVLILLGDETINLNKGDIYNEPGYTATDNEDGDITSNVIVSGNVNTNVVGTYTLTYNATDSGSLSAIQQTRTIIVNDAPAPNSRPVITLTGSAVITITKGDAYTDAGATAEDIEDGNITSNIVKTGTVDTSASGTYTIRYNVTDSGGLIAIEVIRNVIVQDPVVPPVNTRPVITLTGSAVITITKGDAYTDAGATASDLEDGNITSNIV